MSLPSRTSETTVLNVTAETQTKESLCQWSEQQNLQLTHSLSAVYQRDRERSSFLVADQCADAYFSL